MRKEIAALIGAATCILLAGGGGAAAASTGPAPVAQHGGGQVLSDGRAAAAGVISTIAGGVGGPALGTRVAVSPCGVAYGGGHLYAVDSPVLPSLQYFSAVRRVSPRTGFLTTPAGTGEAGPTGDRGPAAKASLSTACGVAVDGSGNLVVADAGRNRIQVVAARTGTFYGLAMTRGDIYTVTGNGTAGFSGDGGPATKAELDYPSWVAVDGVGNLVITDVLNMRVRVVAEHSGTFYGRAMTAGDIYTVAGNGIRGFSGDGGPATKARLNYPAGVAVDRAGNLIIADGLSNRVRVVAARTRSFDGQAMRAGDIYAVAGDGHSRYNGDGIPATKAGLSLPTGVAVDGAGNLVIASSTSNRVRVVAARTGRFYGQAMTAGDIYTVAGDGHSRYNGDGVPATSASLDYPEGVALDGSGNLVIADTNNRVRVVAARTGTFYGQAMTAGDIYTVAGTGQLAFSGDGGPATRAQLFFPGGLAVDHAGNVVISGSDDVTANGNRVQVAAARTGRFFGQAMTAGDIYTVAGNGIGGFTGDGGPATKARLSTPFGVAVDGAGNLVIADSGNNRIRVVAGRTETFYGQAMTAGDIYTVAGDGTAGFSGDGGPATSAKLTTPGAVALDGAGNLVIADSANDRIRVVAARTGTFYGQAMTAGDIYTVAGGGTKFPGNGGPATGAELDAPEGVAVDGAGNLVIAEAGDNWIRVVAARTGTFYGHAMTAGDIYRVASSDAVGFSGDGGPATAAELDNPEAVAVDGAGNLVIADTYNERIRVVAVHTGSFYGQAMTAGDIYTVAGNGTRGFSGDGGPATSAGLNNPRGVAVDGAGNLVVGDTYHARVRLVTG